MRISTSYSADGQNVIAVTLRGESEPYTYISCATPWIARVVGYVLESDAMGCIPDAERLAAILNVAREREVAGWLEREPA